jgi:NhaP-type Na+/H+ or K+/H+ antiporter
VLSTDQVLAGFGLIIVLAVGSQVLGGRLRVPALIILLPAGFIAGAITGDVNPHKLLGPAFQPLVSLSVAVILYNAGLGLNLRSALSSKQHVVRRLILLGVPITWAFAGVFAGLLLGLSTGAAVMIGVILVVSGPTVVDPLMRFVQPVERVRQILSWEGSLIDPIGGVLGAVVFAAVVKHSALSAVGGFFLTIAVGVAGAAIATAVLWLCLIKLHVGRSLTTTAQLACIVGIAAACDIVRDESGLIAAILTGLAVSNMPLFAKRDRDLFFPTLVQLLIGILFISISATVTPDSLKHVVLPTVGLVAILVLVTRPLVALIATMGSDLDRAQRAFIGWMAPRGIVAAATASTFASALVAAHVGGASKILPVTFLVIVMTVALYGLSAVPVAKKLGVRQVTKPFILVVGGQPWVIDVARALRESGVGVMMAAATQDERDQIKKAGLDLAPREALASALLGGSELPDVLQSMTGVLLLTSEDGFNSLGAIVLAAHPRLPVYRLAPNRGGYGDVGQFDTADILFPQLTEGKISRRYQSGSRVTAAQAANGAGADGNDVLFLIGRKGGLRPVTASGAPTLEPGDRAVVLGPGSGTDASVATGSTRSTAQRVPTSSTRPRSRQD